MPTVFRTAYERPSIESRVTGAAGSAPFESPFALSAVATFPTNFVLVTVDKCYVKIVYITRKKRCRTCQSDSSSFVL